VRLFLDANVLFTAAISSEGVSRGITDVARAGACVLVSSAYAVDEATRNVRVKYQRHLIELEAILEHVERVSEAGPPHVVLAGAVVHPKDVPILAAAIAASADILVTGDRRHFGHLYGEIVEAVEVLPPRQALERIIVASG
jgi:uncharacterized protein